MRHGPTGKISVLDVDISVSEQSGHCWTGVLPPVVLFLGTLAGVPLLHVHPVLQRLKRQRRHKKKPEFIRPLWLGIVQGGYDDTTIDQEISKVGGCLIIDAKGVFDAIHRNESAVLSMQDKKIGGRGSCLESDGVTAKRMLLTP